MQYAISDGDNVRIMNTEADRAYLISIGAVYPVPLDFVNVLGSHMRIVNGQLQMKTPEEIAIIDAEEAARVEAAMQAAKSPELKEVENAFLLFCELLTGQRVKLGMPALQQILEAMLITDPNNSVVLSIRLLAVDSQAKRLGGNLWWDSVVWHSEIVTTTTTTTVV